MLAFGVLLLATTAFAAPAVIPHADPTQLPVSHQHQHQHVVQKSNDELVQETVQPSLLKSRSIEHHVPANKVDVAERYNVVSDGTVATARIVKQESEVNPDGSFHNVWKSENGISVQEQGVSKQLGKEAAVVSQGEISYTDDEGNQYYLKYVADENGFRAVGDHLPTPPPVPQGIARGLEFIAAHPYVEPITTPASQQHYQPGLSPVVVDA